VCLPSTVSPLCDKNNISQWEGARTMRGNENACERDLWLKRMRESEKKNNNRRKRELWERIRTHVKETYDQRERMQWGGKFLLLWKEKSDARHANLSRHVRARHASLREMDFVVGFTLNTEYSTCCILLLT